MKKILKSRIFTFILGIIITVSIGIGVYAISADQITYNDTTVAGAITDLYDKYDSINPRPLDYTLNGVVIGKNVERNTYDAFELEGLNEYTKLSLTFSAGIGTWIDAEIYIDNALVTTISDTDKHEITLNHNSTLKIRYIAKNNLGLGGADLHLEAE